MNNKYSKALEEAIFSEQFKKLMTKCLLIEYKVPYNAPLLKLNGETMITKEYLKELCPIHINELSKITGETSSQICKGWLRPYLQKGTFSFIDGWVDTKN